MRTVVNRVSLAVLALLVRAAAALAACDTGAQTLVVCPPNDTTPASTYFGAPVSVRDANGTIVDFGFLDMNGRVTTTPLPPGDKFEVTVGSILQPIGYFDPPQVDFIEMRGFTARFSSKCPKTGELGAISVLKPPRGVVQGAAPTCGGGSIAKGTRVRLLLADAAATVVKETKTDEFGYFLFKKQDPCRGYRLQLDGQSGATHRILAGSPRATLGAPGQEQLYVNGFSANICDVQPDPP